MKLTHHGQCDFKVRWGVGVLWLLGWLGIILILSCCCFSLAYFDFIVNSGFSSILRCLVDINRWLWCG